jgi:MSHA biogenesis protein MshJ
MSHPTWQALARRIDALSLRERVFLFLSLAMLMLALADQAVIAHSLQQQSRWNAQAAEAAAELSGLRGELTRLSGPNAQAQGEVATLQQALAHAQAERQALLSRLDGPAAAPGVRPADLPSLLAKVLKRHGRVNLVQLGTVASGEAAASAALAAAPAAGLTRQGAQFSVSGSYADLQGFVAELETSLPGLRWGELQLRGAEPQPLLTVQVWLSGAAP